MTPEQIEEAQELLSKYDDLESLCLGLQRSEISINVSSSDLLEALNFDAEAIMRMSKQPWVELRAKADSVLRQLTELGVDVSKQRKSFDEKSEWNPISWEKRR